MFSKVKVEVGQVWQSVYDELMTCKITKINKCGKDIYCWAFRDSTKKEELFSKVDECHNIDINALDNWKLVEERQHSQANVQSATIKQVALSHKEQELKFFRSSAHSDVCQKCSAPLPCSYH